MSLSNFPKVLKYAIGDRPYYIPEHGHILLAQSFNTLPNPLRNGRGYGFLRRVIIAGWRIEVYSEDGGTTGVQENYYTVKEIISYTPEDDVPFVENYEDLEFEIPESKLFSSQNHAIISLTPGEYFNYGYNGDNLGSSIFRNWGKSFEDVNPNFSFWVDWAGMDFKSANISGIVEGNDGGSPVLTIWQGSDPSMSDFTGGELGGSPTIITDGCNFTGATLPSYIDTKSKFRTNVFSYDENTTIWTDGNPILRS